MKDACYLFQGNTELTYLYGYYLIDDEVYSLKQKETRKLATRINHNGYRSVQMYYKGEQYTFLLNRLVCSTYHKNTDPLNLLDSDHKDGNPLNNKPWNLEWVTKSTNCLRRGKPIKPTKIDVVKIDHTKRDILRERKKEYYNENKDKINANLRDKYWTDEEFRQSIIDRNSKLKLCPCGDVIVSCKMARHKRTKRHIDIMSGEYQKSGGKLCECGMMYKERLSRHLNGNHKIRDNYNKSLSK